MNDILEIVSRLGSATPRAIAEALGRSPASVRVTIHRLTQRGLLVRTADGTYRLAAKGQPVNTRLKTKTTADVNAGTSGGREDNGAEKWSGEFSTSRVSDSVNVNAVNETLTPDADVSPFVAFAAGYEDAAGEEPPDRLVLAKVRQFLAERGISPFVEAVNEELAAELYLLGYETAGDPQDPEVERWQSEAQWWRQKSEQLEAQLAAAQERNKELLRKLEEVQAESREFRQWAVDLYLRYSDLLDGNLQSQHLTDLVRRGLQKELAGIARRLGIG